MCDPPSFVTKSNILVASILVLAVIISKNDEITDCHNESIPDTINALKIGIC